MSDPVTLARTARESLRRGLDALQGDPNVPPHLAELAQPIAQAMGALFQIERSGGAQLAPHAQNALTAVQGALGSLQSNPTQHPAVVAAMEAVAGALGSVHALNRAAQPPQQAPPQPMPLQAAPQAAPRPAPAPAPQPPYQAAAFAPTAVQQNYQQPAPAPQPVYAQPAQPAPYGPPPQRQPVYAQQPQAPLQQQPRGQMPSGDVPVVNAELGAHSPTNFYKGLSGNDIVDHGGLFVSTYKIPKLGSAVRLKVSLPGGYEFEANAVVKWRRDASDAGSDAPPGFGAQFVQITPEARQLVYRYVRNREPMFHDDL